MFKSTGLRLSPSALGDYKRCERCWWLDKREKIKWPRGIFPSLPGGMDRVLKPYYDDHRKRKVLPAELATVEGILYPDQAKIEQWRRRWDGKLTMEVDGVEFTGMIDDAIAPIPTDPKLVGVLDYKTRGAPPKEGQTEMYYGTQADGYGLLFTHAGYEVIPEGRFIYYWPTAVSYETGADTVLTAFATEIKTVTVEPDRCLDLIKQAISCFNGPFPKTQGCENCEYLSKRVKRSTEIKREADLIK